MALELHLSLLTYFSTRFHLSPRNVSPNYHVLCLFIAKKRVNMCYVTYLPAFCKDLISYLPEIESFLPCLFTIEGFPLYSISPLPLAFASNCLEA